MFLNYLLRLISIIYTLASCHAMDRLAKHDFLISNNYGKIIHLKIEFEYLTNTESSGETDIIIFAPDEEKPIVLQQLLIKNSDTQLPIDPIDLNLKHIIINAWTPGSELTALPKQVPESPRPKELEKVKSIQESSLNGDWNMLKGLYSFFMGASDKPKPPPKVEPEVLKEEIPPYEPLEGCAAIIFVEHINMIRIIMDPIRDLPMISGEKLKLNGYH